MKLIDIKQIYFIICFVKRLLLIYISSFLSMSDIKLPVHHLVYSSINQLLVHCAYIPWLIFCAHLVLEAPDGKPVRLAVGVPVRSGAAVVQASIPSLRP